MNQQLDPQTQQLIEANIKEVKAQSFDQITALNSQISSLSQQIQNQNLILQKIVETVSPDNSELTVDELVAILTEAFQPKPKGGKKK